MPERLSRRQFGFITAAVTAEVLTTGCRLPLTEPSPQVVSGTDVVTRPHLYEDTLITTTGFIDEAGTYDFDVVETNEGLRVKVTFIHRFHLSEDPQSPAINMHESMVLDFGDEELRRLQSIPTEPKPLSPVLVTGTIHDGTLGSETPHWQFIVEKRVSLPASLE